MLCPACQRDLTTMSLTGTLMRWSCEECQLHLLEVVEGPCNPTDLLNVFHQVLRKEVPHDRKQE